MNACLPAGTRSVRLVLLLAAAATAGLALAATPASADLVMHHSLAWLVTRSDHIVEGDVLAVRPAPKRPGFQHIVLRSTGTPIKGRLGRRTRFTPRPELTLLTRGLRPPVGARVVLFTRGISLPTTCGRDPRTGKLHRYPGQVVFRALDPRTGYALPRRDFTVTRGLDPVVAALREDVRLESRRPLTLATRRRRVFLPVPQRSALGGGVHENASLVVPRDGVTERQLVAMTRSPSAADRVLGATLLEPFESRETIRLLLALRHDGARIGRQRLPWVRRAAERVLRRWRVPLPPL